MQVEVEILVQTITAQYGVLSQGDILRTSAEFAAHLVDDCGAAKYVEAKPAVKTETAPDATGVTAAPASEVAPAAEVVAAVPAPAPAKTAKPKT
jgi:hypothetical protein